MRVLVICLMLLGSLWSQEAVAQDHPVHNVNKKVFLVTVSNGGSRQKPVIGGTFCAAEGDVVKYCDLYTKGPKFQPFGETHWGGKSNDARHPISMEYGRFKHTPGRYYLMVNEAGNRTYWANDATYFADLAQGTVVVFNLGGLTDKAAISYAKQQLSKRVGKKMAHLKYISGGAVSTDCQNARTRKMTCAIKKEIRINSVLAR